MTKWFVYRGAAYYPSGETVEAPTAKAAAQGIDDEIVLVFPRDALAYGRDAEGTPLPHHPA